MLTMEGAQAMGASGPSHRKEFIVARDIDGKASSEVINLSRIRPFPADEGVRSSFLACPNWPQPYGAERVAPSWGSLLAEAVGQLC